MIYAIGDIHGELAKLTGLLALIEKRGLLPSDRLVFLGDYIDRGPATKQVLDLLVQLKCSRPGTVFLRGNHDQALMDARDIYETDRKSEKGPHDVAWWFAHGARETFISYGVKGSSYKAIPEDHWKFLGETTLEYREGRYIFVHAGLVPPDTRWREPEDPRLWIRNEFIDSRHDFGATVVFGHTPQDLFLPIVMKNKIGIDTGAAYGGPLTAMVIRPDVPYDIDRIDLIQFK